MKKIKRGKRTQAATDHARNELLRKGIRDGLASVTKISQELAKRMGVNDEVIIGGMMVPPSVAHVLREVERIHGISVSDQIANHFRIRMTVAADAIEKFGKGDLDARARGAR